MGLSDCQKYVDGCVQPTLPCPISGGSQSCHNAKCLRSTFISKLSTYIIWLSTLQQSGKVVKYFNPHFIEGGGGGKHF